jgi:hypothetical protein
VRFTVIEKSTCGTSLVKGTAWAIGALLPARDSWAAAGAAGEAFRSGFIVFTLLRFTTRAREYKGLAPASGTLLRNIGSRIRLSPRKDFVDNSNPPLSWGHAASMRLVGATELCHPSLDAEVFF